jgi:AAA ATPase domain
VSTPNLHVPPKGGLSTADRLPPHDTGCMTPAGTARVTSPRLVGRNDELEALGEFASALRDRQPHVALIRGRAGMGKTRLVTEAALRWRAGGARVLFGGCVPVEGQPYAPFVTAMRPDLASNAPLLRMLAAGQGPTRSELFDALCSSVTGLAEGPRCCLSWRTSTGRIEPPGTPLPTS